MSKKTGVLVIVKTNKRFAVIEKVVRGGYHVNYPAYDEKGFVRFQDAQLAAETR